MAYLIGTDEAGYGPNLGPLVIGCTVWRVPDGVEGEQLYERLPGIVPPGLPAVDCATGTLRIGDSKSLYSPGSGLAGLERAVFAALSIARDASESMPREWRSLLDRCDDSCTRWIDSIPWYAGYDGRVPCDASSDQIAESQRVLAGALAESQIELIAIRARLVFPQEFNERVQQCGSKGSALSLWTLELIARQLQAISQGPVLVQCDKHGGRNRYAALIQHVFPDHLVKVREETRAQSTYFWGPTGRRIEARFIAKGERILPAALASMCAKYLRERAMEAFNAYWQERVPDLKPTAGYPVDARRFRRDIAPRQRELAIPDTVLWRNR